MKRIENLKFKIENYGISFLMGIVTIISSISSLFKSKPTPDDLRKMEFSASSQRLGVSFTEKIRSIFRSRWIKKA